MTPPISKKLPAVAAVPMRKKRASSAAMMPDARAAKNKLAQTKPRQNHLCNVRFVPPGETAIGDDSMVVRCLQPHPQRQKRPAPLQYDNGCSPGFMSSTVAAC
jgi:hypothetical protein